MLAGVLRQQYQNIHTTAAVKSNIERLSKAGTFTICTAHQPVLFAGPLYVIYKIISAIHVAEKLCREFPGNHFVPVYCLGSEDHDFAEINHIWINGDKIQWHQEGKGAVGRLSVKNIIPLLDEAAARLQGKPYAAKIALLLKEAYSEEHTLAEATLHLIDRLFGKYGLVVLIPDNRSLKGTFISVMEQELMHHHSFFLSEQTNKKLSGLGYDPLVNPRAINLFYLDTNLRERIVFNEKSRKYEVLNTSLSFGKDEILKMVNEYPERFSPNVMLRPLFQETILPNLAYVGGAAELSYWLQQKGIFDYYGVHFPMLVLRNSAMLIDSNTYRKITKAEMGLKDLFDDEEVLVQNFVKKSSEHTLDFSSEKQKVSDIFRQIREKAAAVDATLSGAIEAQKAGVLKGMEAIETKMMRAEKRNLETAVSQIKSVKSKLFPGNVLQERVENFLPWYARHGDSFFETLKLEFDPFRKEFLIVINGSAE